MNFSKVCFNKIKFCDFANDKTTIILGRNLKDIDIVTKNYIRENQNAILSDFEKYSIASLSKEILINCGFDTTKFIEEDLAVLLMDKMLNKENSSNNLSLSGDYLVFGLIPSSSLSLKTSKMVFETINRIRSGLVKNPNPAINDFINKYENYLLNLGLFDPLLAIKTAIKQLNNQPLNICLNFPINSHLVLMDNLVNELRYVDFAFICALINKLQINIADVKQLEIPTIETPNLTLVESYGLASEINFVVSEIKNKKYKTGDTAIYTADSSYNNIIKGVFDLYQIPYHFSNGTSPLCNNLIALTLDVLDFLDNHYNIAYLAKIYDNKAINSDTYLLSDEKTVIQYANPEQLNYLSADKGAIRYAINNASKWSDSQKLFLEEILKLDEFPSIIDLYSGLIKLLENFTAKDINEQIVVSLKKKLPYFAYFDESDFNSFSDKVNYIKSILSTIKISEQKIDACIEISSLKGAQYIARNNIFCVGLSATQIEEKCYDSPLICDEKILEMLDGEYFVEESKNKNDRFAAIFKKFLSSKVNANIYLSYSKYDSVNFTQLSKWAELNRIDFNNETKTYGYLDYENQIESSDTTQNNKPLFDNESLDILKREVTRLTASKIETIAKCPIHFFLDNLYIKKEYDEYDANWLKANEEGTLIHECLESYFRKQPDLSIKFDDSLFESCFANSLEKLLLAKPFDSENIKNRTIDNNKKLARNYLINTLDGSNAGWFVLCCEERFKSNDELFVNIEKSIIDTYGNPSSDEEERYYNNLLRYLAYFKEVTITGAIDRIDFKFDDGGELLIRLIDYKTSNPSTFKNYFHAQHLLYPLFVSSIVFKYEYKIRKIVGNSVSLDNPIISFKYDLLKSLSGESIDSNFTNGKECAYILTIVGEMFDLLNENTIAALNNSEFIKREIITNDNGLSVCGFCSYARECIVKLLHGEDKGLSQPKENK